MKKKGKIGKKKKISKLGSKLKNHTQRDIFFVLLVVALFFLGLNLLKVQGLLIPEQDTGYVHGNVVNLEEMPTEHKIAQMVIVAGLRENYYPWRNLQIGGIHLYALPTNHIYSNTIIDFQYGQRIPFFVTADHEGCVTPFIHTGNFTSVSEIDTIGKAYAKGFNDGSYLKKLGFNLNFAPVVDLEDEIWKCRAFPGDAQKIAELAQAYVLGLQTQGIIATIKHYPGKTLEVKDPHKFIVSAEIENDDVLPYDYLLDKGDVGAVMVSHVISSGAVDSEGVPAVVSRKILDEIKREYKGLIISDEIHMLGLKNFYGSLDAMYIGVFEAGNDIILNFDRDPYEVYRMIRVVAAAVEKGEISERQIDTSVTKVLIAKGFVVE